MTTRESREGRGLSVSLERESDSPRSGRCDLKAGAPLERGECNSRL